MAYKRLTEFIDKLEQAGELIRIKRPVSAELEITEITDRISKLPNNQNKALELESAEEGALAVPLGSGHEVTLEHIRSDSHYTRYSYILMKGRLWIASKSTVSCIVMEFQD
jgi:3-polyprenyl-4-hydroxybenzoate decarboxylase